MNNRCKHSYDGVNLICPYGCHGQVSKPLEEITHLSGPKKKPWFSDQRTNTNPVINMLGAVIGQLEVIRHTGASYWECRCTCGELVVREGKDLRGAAKKNINSACSKCLGKRKSLRMACKNGN